MKNAALVGWLLGTAAALLFFFTAGVPLLFLVAFPVGHGAGGAAGPFILFGALALITGFCLWIAVVVKRMWVRR